ncbi:uncharacterized protein LOC116168033 [Photinus pyralis]|nr:uncharacterized protein LOC116168033 [Photinus pyralis]
MWMLSVMVRESDAGPVQRDNHSPGDAVNYRPETEPEIDATHDHELNEEDPFYPSYSPFQSPPLGHSRPFIFQQEAAYSQRPISPFQQQLSYDTYRGGGGSVGGYTPTEASSLGLLGSGNFGVIPGGTFYNDNDGESSGYENKFGSLYQNGHGRPSLFFGRVAKSRPQQQEQFANFRDFADINTPSYSQYVVVYTNKNDNQHKDNQDSDKRPKNIIEQLAMIDQENSTTSRPEKKRSKGKQKLAALLPEKKWLAKQMSKSTTSSSVDLHEPLLALS